ncbi:transposase [Streptomyces sp. NBC_00080]
MPLPCPSNCTPSGRTRGFPDDVNASPAGSEGRPTRPARRGGEVVLIDGTLIPTQRRTGEANRPNHAGRHRRHGLHVIAMTDERGRPVWISAARPGRAHDITAARRDQILAHLRAAGLGAPADLGFLGLDDDGDDPVVVTGSKNTRRPQARIRREGGQPGSGRRTRPLERGFAHLKNWRILTKLRTDPPAPPTCFARCSS